MSNPFTLVHDALWELPLEHHAFEALVRPGNRIRFNNRSPLKKEVQHGDLPELTLTSSGGIGNISANSSSASCLRYYEWLVATGSYDINTYLYEVEWCLYASMIKWHEVLSALQWNSQPFVKRANFADLRESDADVLANRGVQGYSCIWRIEVEMFFSRTHLAQDLIAP